MRIRARARTHTHTHVRQWLRLEAIIARLHSQELRLDAQRRSGRSFGAPQPPSAKLGTGALYFAGRSQLVKYDQLVKYVTQGLAPRLRPDRGAWDGLF